MKYYSMIALVMALAIVACERDDGDGEVVEEGAEEKRLEEDSEELPDQLEVREFVDLAAEAACRAYGECRHEEIRETAALRVMFPVSVGIEMGMARVDDELIADYQEVGSRLQEGSTKLFGGQTCGLAADVAMRFYGVDGESLQRSVDAGRVEFDGVEAVACIEHLRNLPDSCDEEVRLDEPLSFGDVNLPGQQGGSEIDTYLEGCQSLLEGTVGDGENCTYNYECAGELSCVASPIGGDRTGSCLAPGGGALRAPR